MATILSGSEDRNLYPTTRYNIPVFEPKRIDKTVCLSAGYKTIRLARFKDDKAAIDGLLGDKSAIPYEVYVKHWQDLQKFIEIIAGPEEKMRRCCEASAQNALKLAIGIARHLGNNFEFSFSEDTVFDDTWWLSNDSYFLLAKKVVAITTNLATEKLNVDLL